MLLIPQCLLFQILIRVTRQVVVAPAAFLVSTIQKPVRSMCVCVATIQLRFTNHVDPLEANRQFIEGVVIVWGSVGIGY